MTDTLFWWIGVGATSLIGLAVLAFVAARMFFSLVYRRFHYSLFRKTERNLSVASWLNTRLFGSEGFAFDDWPIGPRPFFLSYRFNGERRVFVMLGTMSGPRFSAGRGTHPYVETPHDR